MTNQMQLYHSTEFGSLEILTIDGKLYFPATECAKILRYTNPQKAIRDHCRAEGCAVRSVIDRLGRTQNRKFITEGNLYRLIIRSHLPAADRFERWVFDEILPTLRKYGAFATDETLDAMLRGPEYMDALIEKLIGEHQTVSPRNPRNESFPAQ
jgi:prophage antirepressor-like protein